MDPLEGLRAFIADVVRAEMKLSTAAPANDEYLSTADAAKIARVTPGTVRRWVRAKELSRHGTGGRVRIKRAEPRGIKAAHPVTCDQRVTVGRSA